MLCCNSQAPSCEIVTWNDSEVMFPEWVPSTHRLWQPTMLLSQSNCIAEHILAILVHAMHLLRSRRCQPWFYNLYKLQRSSLAHWSIKESAFAGGNKYALSQLSREDIFWATAVGLGWKWEAHTRNKLNCRSTQFQPVPPICHQYVCRLLLFRSQTWHTCNLGGGKGQQ